MRPIGRGASPLDLWSRWSTNVGHDQAKRKNKVSQDPGHRRQTYRRPDARKPTRNQHELSRLDEKLGVTFQQIQKYEYGRNRVSAALLFEICKALNVTLSRCLTTTRRREVTKAGRLSVRRETEAPTDKGRH